MDFVAILFLTLITFIVGVIVTLVVQYYFLYSYFKKSPVVQPPQRHNSTVYSLPESLKKQLETDDLNDVNGSSLPISLVLQFLFHELRHSEFIKRWLYKKLSLEFDELLTKTTIGRFFDAITIKDMNLGSQFPDIKEISIEDVKLDKKEGHIDTISISLNLDYTGNFLLSVDGKMKFGRTAYLSIKVKKICGLARLQFTRHPYTHWSFSFYNDPILDLAVESHFQGRQLQSNVTNLIVNQIKKAIKRKHTLPNYKIRYKPFFVKTDPSQLDLEDNEIVPQGQLEVSCIEVTRLEVSSNVQNVYCTLAVDSIPWICLYQTEEKMHMILEITITKLRQTQLGVIFKQDQNIVVVESVTQHSCAFRSGLKAGDVVLAVENRLVNSVPQIAKLIKSISSANIALRIERITDNYQLKPKYIDTKIAVTENDDSDLTQMEQDSFVIVDKKDNAEMSKKAKCLANFEKLKTPENMSKLAQTIGNFSLRKRKTSLSSNESNSTRNTPTSSNSTTPQHTSPKQYSPFNAKKHSIPELSELRSNMEIFKNDFNTIEIIKGKELLMNSILTFNDDFLFTLKDGLKYLNINVWGTTDNDKDILLGYINIPLSHILNECLNSVLGHYMRTYSFLPPINTQNANLNHPLMSHSGFEQVFCYGDILLSFVWSHEDDVELKRKMSCADSDLDKPSNLNSATATHDFIRTQFHRTTHCDFCSKKIWLKDAVQCRQCGLCCHKKCIVKCQMSTGCVSNSDRKSENIENQPEIKMTEVCDDLQEIDTIGLKRVNSVNNLAIPGSHLMSIVSRSLPPSPQHTPNRKQSLIALNPFSLCPTVLEDIWTSCGEAGEQVGKLLEQVMLCPPDEGLMDTAKESGKVLYAHMPHEERVEKINKMMAELKKTLDSVTMEHMELSKQMSCEESEVEKTKLAFLLGQADAKVHGLSVLMLHYCSSLQYTQEKIV